MQQTPRRIELYTLKYLSTKTGIPSADILSSAKNAGISVLTHEGEDCAKRDDLPELFRVHFKGQEYSMTYRMPSWLMNSGEPWCTTLVDMYADPVTRPTSLSPQQGEFLRSLVVNSNPQCMVEIGTFLGISTIWTASALQDARRGGVLHSVDLFEDIFPFENKARTKCIIDPYPLVQSRIDQAGLSKHVRFYKGDSKALGKSWDIEKNGLVDILYIDGDHTIPGCAGDFEAWCGKVRPGGFIIFHDIFPEICGCDGPAFMLKRLSKSQNIQSFSLETSPHNYGMAVLRVGCEFEPRKNVLE